MTLASFEAFIGRCLHVVLQLPDQAILALVILYAVLMLIAWARIFGRAGFSPFFVLLLLIPCANIIFLLGFAFSRWPIEKRR